MKIPAAYLAASGLALGAAIAIVLGSEPRTAGAIAEAARPAPATSRASSAWPEGVHAMARRPEHRWLLRAMSPEAAPGTLPTTPDEPAADPTSL